MQTFHFIQEKYEASWWNNIKVNWKLVTKLRSSDSMPSPVHENNIFSDFLMIIGDD